VPGQVSLLVDFQGACVDASEFEMAVGAPRQVVEGVVTPRFVHGGEQLNRGGAGMVGGFAV
jgi:hypothetical protein